MTTELISLDGVLDHLTPQDDAEAWRAILSVIGGEFVERYRADVTGNSLGSSGLERVLTGGDHIKHAGRRQEDLHGPLDIPGMASLDLPNSIGL